MRNDVVAYRTCAELRADFARLLEHAEPLCASAEYSKYGERSGRGSARAASSTRSLSSRRAPRSRLRRPRGRTVRRPRLRGCRALAQVDAREMEAEHFGRTHERREARRGERRAVVFVERRGQHLQVGDERFGIRVRDRTHGRRAAACAAHRHRAFAETHARARGEARIDADQRAAIRFVDAVRRLVGEAAASAFTASFAPTSRFDTDSSAPSLCTCSR